MLTIEEQIQKTVASLDAGDLAKWVWRGVFAFVAIGLSVFFMVHEFHGLPMSQAMDQAQIGREILRGHGWQTKFIRPLAIGELRRHGKDVKTGIAYDTYNGPIGPLLDAAALYIPITEGWKLEKTDIVYSGDKAIALMGVLFFLGSLGMLFLIATELFDKRLAYMATGLTMICDMMWQYSITGLPLMELLFMLHVNVYVLLRAMRARYLNERHLGWMAALGLGFGVMALTHALSIFIFFPVLVFAFFFFRPRPVAALLMLGVFLAVYTPWLVRNAMVCGDFRGLAGFCGLDGIVHSESGHMRRFAIDLGDTSGNYFAENFRVNLTGQINRLIEYLGWSCVAPVALVSVLHAFKRPITATFRWLLFSMWGSAICGMAIFGMKEEHGLAADQFHLLFVPLLICYGMAYILVQWDRRIGLGFILPAWSARSGVHYVMRMSLVIVIFLLSGIPLLARLALSKNRWQVEWPPYMPPYIAAMGKGFAPDEIIGSDMPWAVAWYADRRSIWLPYDPQALQDLSDYQRLGGPVAGLYFTPISGTMNTLADLVNGEYRHWAAYIVRTINLKKSPYPIKTIMGMTDCVLYMDTDRRQAMAK
ncbi:MAG TPA: glycosyltransferase family 39 protein [Chthoniobacteraceae bacterium]|jgi:hypothetical protein|nr:glycosyltransferase family 39 protein [Chthoniobacteraceae bacterium]